MVSLFHLRVVPHCLTSFEGAAIVGAQVRGMLLSDQVISIHLQTALWQSPSKQHFISLIGTFVHKSFAYREVLLSFCEFGSQHTGQNIARAIFSILEEYKIISKLTGITTDGALFISYFALALDYTIERICGLQ
jgi:hypothetical protein